ncbi:putative FBD-associated F-box protein At5g53635 isoform X1 [Arabidopsis lyrata subsp. lyrata]|uniref:putative FBD-associated F-box protein At5g53635 isoform X1 n=1 Tax=Arabidopsis lyrata subsp. lyrata TaxID=81972 RepID=UPI000A29BB19|nr:putative FBD-associated F-box protein At5g53635 isoform X1 [Arabidopsis lyrata subsp. lyrata]|eukprot:XP_020881848.1 putative FBD-associated F-box protein At5g53635 isoform X1 [Arabidopsis lyrata subsp. lyrata]
MVTIGESKQACSGGYLCQTFEEDRISQLPDPLICQILSHLPTKEAVTTSVLSIRWRTLWLWVSGMELDSRQFPDNNAFLSFGDRFFDSSMVSCIHKLTIIFGRNPKNNDDSCFPSWLNAAIKRKIQRLDVRWTSKIYLHNHTLRLYNCETLVYLRLYGVLMDDAVFGILPCLKTMHLEENCYTSEATFEKLVSSCCPVLENLKIVASDIDGIVYRVRSPSLKRLSIERKYIVLEPYCVPGVLIDAPLLCCLTIDDHDSYSFIVKNLQSNAELNISYLDFRLGKPGVESRISSRLSNIRDFLLGISRVGNMKICLVPFKVICGYSEQEPLPQFDYISRLCISLDALDFKWLELFLRTCPNQKSLVLMVHDTYDFWEIYQSSFQYVPKCLVSSLEFVDFKFSIRGHDDQMKIVRYFLENSAILKKLTLRLANHSKKDEISKEVFEIPRSSTKCEVVIV